MKTFIFSSFQIAVAFFTALFFASCHFSDPVPLPVEFTSFPQPQMQPLRLSNPVQLRWDTLAHTLIQPAVFPLDFKNLNGQDYDPNGFKTLPTSPLQLPFNFPGSPSRPFNFKRIVEYPLKMETKVMPLPASATKFQKPERVTAATMDTKEWQQISGLNLIIRGMTTDTSGMIWFGTSNGIYRFDGIQLANFLPGTSINGLCFDKEGNLWCLDQSNLAQAAILKFDFRKGTLGKAYFNFSANGGFVLMQADPSGYIVIAGSSAMPFPVLLDPVKNSYRILNALAGFKSAGYFRGIIDRDNRFWLGSVNGIEVIDRNSDKVYQITRSEGLSHDTVTCIASGKDRRIWAAVPGGVDMFDLKAKRITQYKFRNSGSLYHCMLVDDEGQLWLGGDDGIDILNPSNNTFRHAGPAEGLAWPSVSEFLEDNTGQIMAAGSNGSFFTIYFISQFGKTVYPFGNTNIISAAEDSRGHLWVGTDKGLFVVDSLRRYFRRLSTADGIAGSEIGAITKKEGSIVITTNNGYNIYEPDKGQLFRVGKGEGLLRDTVSSETTDADGNEWITGGFSGITKYDALHRVALSLNAGGGLNGNTIIQTMQLNNNKMLVLPEESGPSIIDLAHNTIQTIKGYKGINSFTGKRMIRDSAGRIWISGQLNGWGVYMIDSGLKTISRFTKREGLSDDAVFSVSEFRGRILVAANEKVNIITPPDISGNQKWHVQVMAKSEDLKKSYRNVMADAVTKSGNYLWSDAGLKVIYGIFPDTSQSRNFISGIAIMGKQMQFNDSSEIHLTNAFGKMSKVFLSKLGYEAPGKIHWEKLSVPFNIPENLSVPDKENVIRFQFTELSSGRQDSVNFAYVLEGIDKKWTITNESQTDSYLNLTPGNYNFKVTSRWINGRWNTPTSFQFTIRPPWYGTWWAYIVYAILLLTAILGINRVQRNMVIAKERQRSRIREAQLKAEAENDRRKNAELISEMGRDITSSLSIKNIINTVYNHVNKLMDASVFGIGIYDREKNRIEFPATKENGAILPRYHYQLDDNRRPAVWCFNNKKELFMNDFEKEHTNYISEIAEAAAGKNAESVIYLPLIYKDRGIGVITAQSFSKNSFNEYHLNILRSLASYIVVALDNAETYKKLQSAQTQLVRSEKMASLGELAAGIAHEIQNPLNFVNNFSEINREIISDMREEIKKGNLEEISLLADNIDTNEERIIHHGHRADAIVKSMLQHTRGTTGQKEPTDINALADEYLRLSYHGMRARDKSFNSDYQTDFDKSLSADISGKGKIDVVPQEIGRVLLNLLNNAFYAVNEKKNKENGKYSPSVLVRTKDFSNRVEIGVKDNGSGIPEKILEKIFQPFFTTKPTGSGTGLGLSLSYDIVKAHGGEIEVNSEENEGATFTIILPKSK